MTMLINLLVILLTWGFVLSGHLSLSYGIQRLLTVPMHDLENTHEACVRKAWLRAFSYMINIAVVLLIINIYIIFKLAFLPVLIGALFAQVVLWYGAMQLNYSCAYLAHGTKFLLFSIIFFGLKGITFIQNLLMMIFLACLTMSDLQGASLNETIWISLIGVGACLGVFCSAYFWINSIRLFRVNRAHKKNVMKNANEHNETVDNV